jgi:hypothetical protein
LTHHHHHLLLLLLLTPHPPFLRAAIDCAVSEWSDWLAFAGGGSMLRRHRTREVAPAHGGALCPALLETKLHECVPGVSAGEWSACSASCGGGMRTGEHVHVVCSANAALRSEYTFRHEEACNTHACPAVAQPESP